MVVPVAGSASVSVQAFVRLQWGSQAGVCGEHHLLEHVLVAGGWRPCGAVPCSTILANRSISTNASVAPGLAMYKAGGPVDEMGTMLDFITGIVLDPIIRADAVQREKPAVRAEMKPKLGRPDTAFALAASDRMYTCNSMKDVADVACQLKRLEGLTAKDMETLYKKAYVRRAMLFVVAGPISIEEGKEVFRRSLRAIDRLPPLGGVRSLCGLQQPRFQYHKTPDKVARLALSFRCTLPVGSRLLPLFGFFRALLTGGLTSFLYSVLRTQVRRVYKVDCGAEEVGNEALVWISTSCAPKDGPTTLEAMVGALEVARNGGIPAPLLESSKRRAVFGLETACWTSPTQAAAFYAPQFLVPGRHIVTPAALSGQISRLTAREVARLIRAMIPAHRCSVTYGAPTSPGLTLRKALHL